MWDVCQPRHVVEVYTLAAAQDGVRYMGCSSGVPCSSILLARNHWLFMKRPFRVCHFAMLSDQNNIEDLMETLCRHIPVRLMGSIALNQLALPIIPCSRWPILHTDKAIVGSLRGKAALLVSQDKSTPNNARFLPASRLRLLKSHTNISRMYCSNPSLTHGTAWAEKFAW